MNGALFGTMKVIGNITHMLSCRRTKHPVHKQFMLFFYFIYYIANFLLGFFTIGSMYAAITVFLDQEFSSLMEITNYYDETGFLSTLFSDNLIGKIFSGLYIALIFMAIVFSLTTPVDKGIAYFKLLMGFFGMLLLLSMVGIMYYLSDTGFYPHVKARNETTPNDPKLYETEDTYFSWLVFAGVVMCSVFLIPMLLRPLDFVANFKNYTFGLLSYLFMMPTFTNIMQIYAMCNLHDISWGNRPT
jgi:chitin synthase